MNTKITIDNYEEIMFRLVEDDFDEPTRKQLLEQIEGNVLFKFEWDQWQKTRCTDPLENYAAESLALTEKIIQIVKTPVFTRKRKVLYLAAASIAALITSVVLFTADFNSGNKQVVESESKTPAFKYTHPPQRQNTHSYDGKNDFKQSQRPGIKVEDIPMSEVIITPEVIAENANASPVILDSISESRVNLASVSQEKTRYTITIETTRIEDGVEQMSEIAQNERVKLNKLFTNTKILFRRKPNGEPDKIILVGEEENFLCINLNQTIK
ncbi:MAG: hypothetical protein RBS33_15060 [Lentimicrobium sp.]|jgi:cell division protein FtsL|nr:hypothetical protein [Lentimicrobium sp.]